MRIGRAGPVLDRNREKGKGLAKELSGKGDAVSFHFCEVADEASVQAATDAAAREHGGIHVLVHCAGIQRYGDVLGTSVEVWRETLGVHLDGCFYAVRSALPHMLAAGGGSIVIVGSVRPSPRLPVRRPMSPRNTRWPASRDPSLSITPGKMCGPIA